MVNEITVKGKLFKKRVLYGSKIQNARFWRTHIKFNETNLKKCKIEIAYLILSLISEWNI